MFNPSKKQNDDAGINQRSSQFKPENDPVLQFSDNQRVLSGGGGSNNRGASSFNSVNSATTTTTTTSSINGQNKPAYTRPLSTYQPSSYMMPYNSTGPGQFMPYNSPYFAGPSPYSAYPNSMHLPGTGPMGLISYAQESAMPVFSRAAQLMQAVGTVTQMLDTIFMGFTGSFNAILTVIGELANLKNNFTRVLSAFAILRSIKYLYRRVLNFLGLSSTQHISDAWADAQAEQAALQTGVGRSKGSGWWSLRQIMLRLLMFTLPVLLWQLMEVLENTNWNTRESVNQNAGATAAQVITDSKSNSNVTDASASEGGNATVNGVGAESPTTGNSPLTARPPVSYSAATTSVYPQAQAPLYNPYMYGGSSSYASPAYNSVYNTNSSYGYSNPMQLGYPQYPMQETMRYQGSMSTGYAPYSYYYSNTAQNNLQTSGTSNNSKSSERVPSEPQVHSQSAK